MKCSVVNHSSNRTAFPWCILSIGDSGVTAQQFYDEKIMCKLQKQGVVNEMKLESAFWGKSKDSFDRIDLSLPLDSAVQLFDPFLQYLTCDKHQELPPAHDSFTVLMAN